MTPEEKDLSELRRLISTLPKELSEDVEMFASSLRQLIRRLGPASRMAIWLVSLEIKAEHADRINEIEKIPA